MLEKSYFALHITHKMKWLGSCVAPRGLSRLESLRQAAMALGMQLLEAIQASKCI